MKFWSGRTLSRTGAACRAPSDRSRESRLARNLAFGLIALLVPGLAGCGVFHRGTGQPDIVEIVWEQGEQYVRIEKQDEIDDRSPPPNSHPANFQSMQIRNALSRVFYQPTGDSMSKLFNPPELNSLSVQLANALREAGSDEDVTFLIHTRAKGWIGGYTGPPQITTGRVFVKDRVINVIFGAVRVSTSSQRFGEKQEIMPVGFRQKALASNTGLTAEPDSGVYRPRGLTHRKDWLVFFPTAYESGPLQPDTFRETAPTVSADDQPATDGAPARRAPAQISAEERLKQLERLRRDGLITDEEYQYKRAQILQGL